MLPLLALLACHRPPPAPTEPLSADAARTAALAQREAGLVPVAARFSIRLESSSGTVNAAGAIVVRPPDAFRVELSGPIGPPQLVVASNGTAINAWLAGKTTYYQGDDAAAALRGLTGGAAGLELVTALLLGQLSEPDAVGLTVTGPVPFPRDGDTLPHAGPEWRWTWCTEAAACVTEGLAQPTGRLTTVDATASGLPLLHAEVTPGAATPWPSALEIRILPLGARATVEFHSWAPATPPDAAFELAPPPGATITPLAVGTTTTGPAPSATP